MKNQDQSINVVVVDDESLVLDDLNDLIDWKQLGCNVLGMVRNARQALNIIDRHNIDLVITDIKMPGMDGITLGKLVKERSSATYVIALSAYRDFDFARRAVNCGIDNYLLKDEITAEVLETLLIDVRVEVEKNKQSKTIITEKDMAKIFGNLMVDCLTEPKLSEDVDVHKLYYHVLLQKEKPIPFTGFTGLEEVNRDMSWTHVVKPLWQDNTCQLALCLGNDSLLLCFEKPNNQVEEMFIATLVTKASVILKKQVSIKMKVVAFVLTEPKRIQQFADEFVIYTHSIQATFFNKAALVQHAPKLADFLIHTVISDSNLTIDIKRLYLLADQCDLQNTLAIINDVFSTIKMRSDYEGLKRVSCLLYNTLDDLLLELNDNSIDISPENNIAHWSCADDIHAWFLEKYKQVYAEMQCQTCQSYSPITQLAIKYIKDNFQRPDLVIEGIANDLSVSSSTLCTTFRKDVNKTINEFITDMRMHHARLWIKSGQFKVYEIAEQLGYGSSQYFSYLFFQKTGLTPSEYKRVHG